MQEFQMLEPNEDPIKRCRRKKGDPIPEVIIKHKAEPKPRIIIKPEAEPSRIILSRDPLYWILKIINKHIMY